MAGCLVVYCTIRYIQNRNATSTEYKTYHQTSRDLYPSICFCFMGLAIYDSERMKEAYGIQNFSDYPRYLSGHIWNKTMVDVDYDYVTGHLDEYFNGLDVSLDATGYSPVYRWLNRKNKVNITYSTDSKVFPFFISQRSALTKCFTFNFSPKMFPNITGKIIRRFMVYLNTTKPLDVIFSVSMNYPGQVSRSIPMDLEVDRSQNIMSGNLDVKLIEVGIIEVLRRRKGSKESCNLESEKTDEFLYKKVADELNCKPSHWKNVDHPNICNNMESMQRSNFDEKVFFNSDDLKEVGPPCDELIDIDYKLRNYPRGTFTKYSDVGGGLHKMEDIYKLKPGSASLLFTFDRAIYREITHFRAYNLEGLIGNGGGYVGLFLGFAVWQIPDFCYLIYQLIASKNV